MSEPRISDYIKVNRRFTRSAHLERDFNDSDALEGYVSTPETIENLKRISTGFSVNSRRRAWRVIGDYGSGKSSFALLLSNLVSRQSSLIPKELRDLKQVINLPKRNSKYIPVLVTGAREPMSKALLNGVINAFCDWDGLGKTHELTKKLIDLSARIDISDNELLQSIAKSVRQIVEAKIADGLLIVIDELGKFLEHAALHPEQQDVFFLQQLGELSERSADSPIFTLCLLHQGFSAYADSLSESAQKEWEKISGRYEQITFSQPLSQIAVLLSMALSGIDFEKPRGWKTLATSDMSQAIELGIFGAGAPKGVLRDAASDLYPLHPTILPVFTRFFRKFGQNERSLFSFLLSSEPFALQDFASKEANLKNIYRLSDFYDFAAANFSTQLSRQSFRSHWSHIDAVIRSAEGELPEIQALLKTIGILNITETLELKPTEELLTLACDPDSDISKLLISLRSRNIIFQRARGSFALWPHSSVNLESAISNAEEYVSQSPKVSDIVKSRLDSRPIVAARHYIKTGNLRHFDVAFYTASEFSVANFTTDSMHPASGKLIIVLCDNKAQCHEASSFARQTIQSDQILIAISPPLEALSGFAKELEKWLWVERNTLELKDDRFASEEVSRQVEVYKQQLEQRINDLIGFRINSVRECPIEWYHKGRAVKELNNGTTSIQTFLSDLCGKVFEGAPRVNNELINRNNLSSAAAAARQRLFKLILENHTVENFGLPEDKAPPEKSIYLSVFKEGKLHRKGNDQWAVGIPNKEDDTHNFIPALNTLQNMLAETLDSKVNVGHIYDELRSAPYGVRDGMIPLLLLVYWVENEHEMAVYEDGRFMPCIDDLVMQRLVKKPESFEFQLCKVAGVRKTIIKKLAEVVSCDAANSATILSVVRPLCLFVDSLPDYTKQTETLSSESRKLRDVIANARDMNPRNWCLKRYPNAWASRIPTQKSLLQN